MSEGTDWAWCYENPLEAAAVIDGLEARCKALQQDADCFRWLVSEHDRVDPVVAVVWKQGATRNSSEWVNTINGRDLIATTIIEMNEAKKESK